ICFAVCSALELAAQDLLFRKITSSEGLSHHTVYDITQDHSGIMWFGTREGLSRYDGHEVITYYLESPSPGGSVNKINALAAVEDVVYVGSDDGLFLYDPVQDKLTRSSLLSEHQAILMLHACREGLFVGTSSSFYRIDNQEIHLLSRHHTGEVLALTRLNQNR